MPRVALDLRLAGAMAQVERVRHGAVEETERHAGVRGMHERALTLHEQELPSPLTPLDDKVARRPRGICR